MKTKEEVEKRITKLYTEITAEVLKYSFGGKSDQLASEVRALQWVLKDEK